MVEELRQAMQSDTQRWASDLTHSELEYILRQCRQENGGISLMEMAGIIREALGDDAKLLKDLI